MIRSERRRIRSPFDSRTPDGRLYTRRCFADHSSVTASLVRLFALRMAATASFIRRPRASQFGWFARFVVPPPFVLRNRRVRTGKPLEDGQKYETRSSTKFVPARRGRGACHTHTHPQPTGCHTALARKTVPSVSNLPNSTSV